LSDLARDGVAVLMFSSELPEVLGMADRSVVLFEGRVSRSFLRAEADEHSIMRAATGLAEEAA
jgi:rhamnose transport system ATP-binding protein